MAREWEFITRPTLWGGSEYVLRQKDSNSGCGCLIGAFLILFMLLALFAYPYKLMDSTFLPFKFKWLRFRDVWIFSLSAWLSLMMLITVLKAVLSNRGMKFDDIFDTPFLTTGLFSFSLSTFIGYLLKSKFPDDFSNAYLVYGLLMSGIVLLIVKSAEFKKRVWLLIVTILLIIAPYFYLNTYSQIPTSMTNTIEIPENKLVMNSTLIVVSKKGANIRQYPSKTAAISYTIPVNTSINFLSDSFSENEIVWYKVAYNGQEGWVCKKLVEKQ